MNAVSTLKKNIELKFNTRADFAVYNTDGNVVSNLNPLALQKLEGESEEIINTLFDINKSDYKDSQLNAIRYILSNDKLFNRFKSLSNRKDIFTILFDYCKINKKISADDLAKFNLAVAAKLFNEISPIQNHDTIKYSDLVLYISKELDLYNVKDMDILDAISSLLIDTSNSVLDNTISKEKFVETIRYGLDSGLLKYLPIYKKLSTAKKLNFTAKHIEYINFLGENTDCNVSDLKIEDFAKSNIETLLELVKSIKNILLVGGKNLILGIENLAKVADYESEKDISIELMVKNILTVLHDYDFNIKEVNTFFYKLNNQEKITIFEGDFYSSSECLYFGILKYIYPNFIENSDEISSFFTINFMHYLLQNNKKKFLKILRDNDLIPKLHTSSSALLKKSVYSILNLNALKLDEIKWLIGDDDEVEVLWEKGCCISRDVIENLNKIYGIMLNLGIKNISIDEFKFLITAINTYSNKFTMKPNNTAIYIWLYLKASNAGDEMKKALQIPSLDNDLQTRRSYIGVFESIKDELIYNKDLQETLWELEFNELGFNELALPNASLAHIAELVREKPFNERIFEAKKSLTKTNIVLSNDEWLKFFLLKDVNNFKSQLKNEADILFFVRYYKELKGFCYSDLESAKKLIYINSREYKDFIDKINISDDFIADNQDRIYEFFLKGLMEVFSIYHSDLRTGNIQNNLSIITKAELAGKLDEVKFYPGDLEKEIGYPISDKNEKLWIKNTTLTIDDYKVAEKYDYETILKLGVNPVSTCMNYNGGAYNECLLSNFDANKKIITVSKNGKLIGRAVLRLTKISDKEILTTSSRGFAFKDVEKMDKDITTSENEKLALFLERCYTSDNDVSSIKQYMTKLAIKKAKEMGVRLILSSNYSSSIEYKYISDAYIYISQSRNGKQYLDSFGGETTNNKTEYVRLNDKNPVLLPNEDMFNGRYEFKNE